VNGNELRTTPVEGASDALSPDEDCPDFARTMPSSAFDGLAVSAGAAIYVLSTDHEFVATVRRVSGAHHAIVIVDDWQQLLEAVNEGRCAIALIDVEGAGGSLARRLAELGRGSVPPVIIAAAAIKQAPEPMQALTERKIHRLLIKPASLGNTRMVLEAAITRSRQLRPARTGGPPAETPRAAAAPSPPRRGVLWLGAGAAVALAVVAAGLVNLTSRDASPVTVPPEAPATGDIMRSGPASAPRPDPFAEQLAWADSALEVGLLAEPPHDNALEGYATILALDPDHALARAGLAATVGMLFTQAENALLEDSLELAATTLEQVRRVQPDHHRLAFLDTQLEKARAAAADPIADGPASPAVAPSEVERLLALSQDRIRRGQLIAPARDNATAFYSRAAALDRENPAVLDMRTTLRAALVASAEQSLAAGDVEPVESLITALQSLGTATSILADLDRRLSAVSVELQQERQAATLAEGLERLAGGQLVAPENDNAAFYLASLMSDNIRHPGLPEFRLALTEAIAASIRTAVADGELSEARMSLAALQRIDADTALIDALRRGLDIAQTQAEFLATAIPAAELALVAARAPTYPTMALRNNIEGWVDLEFVVDQQGEPRDIVVTAAEPEGTFERAATAAVARYRFQPFVMDGVTYERRARVRVRFALQ
jgi:periplasmic protein TonB